MTRQKDELDTLRVATHNEVVDTTKAEQARAKSLARSLATSKRTLAHIAKRLESGDYRTPTTTGQVVRKAG